jgi:hypothetical protein
MADADRDFVARLDAAINKVETRLADKRAKYAGVDQGDRSAIYDLNRSIGDDLYQLQILKMKREAMGGSLGSGSGSYSHNIPGEG